MKIRTYKLNKEAKHKNDIRNNNRNNPIVKHISKLDHPVNIENASIVQFVNDIKLRKLIESFVIKNSNNFNFIIAV